MTSGTEPGRGSQRALVSGASRGIGLELVRQLLDAGVGQVFAACRSPQSARELRSLAGPDRLRPLRMDVSEEADIAAAAKLVAEQTRTLELIVNCAGMLHIDGTQWPERRLADIDPAAMQRSYAVNALGPLLVAKHFQHLLPGNGRCVFASISARVGSIGDNRLGGWYAYRMAKAAQNMATRNLSIELRRRARGLICVAVHPGTVDTGLSRPFQDRLPPGQLQPVDLAVRRILRVLNQLQAQDNGRFYAFDGEELPW